MDATVLNINNNNIIQNSVEKQKLLVKSEQLDKADKPSAKVDPKVDAGTDINPENITSDFDKVIASVTAETASLISKDKIQSKQDIPEQTKESIKNTILLVLPKPIKENNIKLISSLDSEIIPKKNKPEVTNLTPEIYKAKLPKFETTHTQPVSGDIKKLLTSLQKYTGEDIKQLTDSMSSVVIKKDVPQISTLNNLPLPIQADKDLLISNFTRELSFTTKTPQTIKDLQPVENKNPDTKQNTDTPQQKQVPEDSKTIREIKIVENIRKIEELIYGIPITKPIDVNSPTSDSKLVNEAKPLSFNQKFNLSEITNITNNLVAKLPDNGNYSAILHLKPESLGSVMIEMTLKNNMLNLTFKADSPEAARAIESQLANLSEKLSSNGIHTQSVEVSYGNEKDMTRDYGDQHQKTAKEERETKEELLKSYRMLQNMNNEYSEDLIMPGNFLRMMKMNQLYRN